MSPAGFTIFDRLLSMMEMTEKLALVPEKLLIHPLDTQVKNVDDLALTIRSMLMVDLKRVNSPTSNASTPKEYNRQDSMTFASGLHVCSHVDWGHSLRLTHPAPPVAPRRNVWKVAPIHSGWTAPTFKSPVTPGSYPGRGG